MADGRVSGVRLASGKLVPAETVLVGIGVVPRDELAATAGLDVRDGVLVDVIGRTSDPHIWAAGDVARVLADGSDTGGVRRESWRPAIQQAEHAAADMMDVGTPYDEVPWTWSDQYDVSVQIAGTPAAGTVASTFSRLDGSAMLVLEADPGTRALTAAYGLSTGAGIGKAITAAQLLIKSRQAPAAADIAESGGDYDKVTQVLSRAARALLSGVAT